MANIQMYGENGATFLLFQSLALRPDGIRDILLSNLKRFSNGRPAGDLFKKITNKDIEVWLFPNFGKSRGFGEPDVLILADEHVFWVEVETESDFQYGLPSLQKSLVQLWRFKLFQDALKEGRKKTKKSWRILGKTLTDEREMREANVMLKGHGALQTLYTRLNKAGLAGKDNYVLFTISEPRGTGNGGDAYQVALARQTRQLCEGYRNEIKPLPVEKCWYAYWRGDLRPKWPKGDGFPDDFDNQYVPKK